MGMSLIEHVPAQVVVIINILFGDGINGSKKCKRFSPFVLFVSFKYYTFTTEKYSIYFIKVEDKEDVEGGEEEDGGEGGEDAEVSKFLKELESQTFSCSDCGVKTPSRMTYMQHVLNGCIMDEPAHKVRRNNLELVKCDNYQKGPFVINTA